MLFVHPDSGKGDLGHHAWSRPPEGEPRHRRGVGRQPQHQVVRVIDSTIQAGSENGVVVQM